MEVTKEKEYFHVNNNGYVFHSIFDFFVEMNFCSCLFIIRLLHLLLTLTQFKF